MRSVGGVTHTNQTAPAIRFLRLDTGAVIPRRAHRGDAGVDLAALERTVIEPGERALVGTGLAIALPLGYVGLIHPRSGLALRYGLSIVNTPGTIDADYRGEIKVCLINLDPREPITIEPGDRIAQLVIQKVELCDFVETDALDETVRGASGYGSTGIG
nr:dUTP diphosphatase [Corynebacterium marambiense]